MPKAWGALLGQELIYADGTRVPMAGVVPWSYRIVEPRSEVMGEAASLRTISLDADNWLVHGCGRLRGYAGCSRLQLVDNGREPTKGYEALSWYSRFGRSCIDRATILPRPSTAGEQFAAACADALRR